MINLPHLRLRLLLWIPLAGVLACGSAEPSVTDVGVPRPAPIAEDLVVAQGSKSDGTVFNPNFLVDDHVFEDGTYLTAAQIQSFLESTPYDKRSFLADWTDGHGSAAQLIAAAAKKYRINPLALLARLQVEWSLVYRDEAPKAFALDHAMGCGCHDGDPYCTSGEAGFANQLECGAGVFRKAMDDLLERGATVSGWRVGKAKTTLDPKTVTPANRATAALYTYTPWVLEGRGGNWLFWNVFRKFSMHLLKATPNHHWVGGACTTKAACTFDDGTCLNTGAAQFCTSACDRYCPDTKAEFTATTFCADLGTSLSGIPGGWCLARCDETLFPGAGCAPGFDCIKAPRMNEPGVERDVCWPR